MFVAVRSAWNHQTTTKQQNNGKKCQTCLFQVDRYFYLFAPFIGYHNWRHFLSTDVLLGFMRRDFQ